MDSVSRGRGEGRWKTDLGEVDGLESELPETLTTVDGLLAGSCYSSSSKLAADSVLRGESWVS